MEDRNLSLSAVAGTLGVSERTVRRWIQSGKLRAYKPGRDYRIPESAVRNLVEDSEISPIARALSPLESGQETALPEDEVLFEAYYSPESYEEVMAEAMQEAKRHQVPEGMQIAALDNGDKVEVRIVPTTPFSRARRGRRLTTKAPNGRETA